MAAKTKAPAWLKCPAGVSFGFGGKLAQFTNAKRQLATGEVADTGSVTISQVRHGCGLAGGLGVKACLLLCVVTCTPH